MAKREVWQVSLNTYVPNEVTTSNQQLVIRKCYGNYHFFDYLAKSVFALWFVNLRSITYGTDKNFKSKHSFAALNLSISKKWLWERYHMSENPVDLDVTFKFFQILTCVYLRTKLRKKLNRNLTQEEDFSQCLKILSQITAKKIRMNWQRSETFCQRKTSSPSTMITNLSLPWQAFLPLTLVFQRLNEKKMEATSS